MPSEKCLNLFQRGQITFFLEQNWNISKISEQLKVSWHSVKNFVTKGNKYGGQKKRGRKPRMTPSEKSIIIRCSSNSSITANQIKASTVWRLLNPALTRFVKIVPLLFGRKWL